MPWLTINTHVTPEDAAVYEQMLDTIAEQDRHHRLMVAYAPAHHQDGAWQLIDCPPRCADHHD